MLSLIYTDWSVLLRAGMAFALSLVLVLLCGLPVINLLHKHQKTGQPIR